MGDDSTQALARYVRRRIRVCMHAGVRYARVRTVHWLVPGVPRHAKAGLAGPGCPRTELSRSGPAPLRTSLLT